MRKRNQPTWTPLTASRAHLECIALWWAIIYIAQFINERKQFFFSQNPFSIWKWSWNWSEWKAFTLRSYLHLELNVFIDSPDVFFQTYCRKVTNVTLTINFNSLYRHLMIVWLLYLIWLFHYWFSDCFLLVALFLWVTEVNFLAALELDSI